MDLVSSSSYLTLMHVVTLISRVVVTQGHVSQVTEEYEGWHRVVKQRFVLPEHSLVLTFFESLVLTQKCTRYGYACN